MSVGASGDTGVTAKGRHQGSCCSAPPVSASLIKYFSLLLSSSQADIFATVAFTVPCLFVHRRLRDGTAWLRIKGWHTNCHRVLCRHTTVSVPRQASPAAVGGWRSSPGSRGTQKVSGCSSGSRQRDEMYTAQKRHRPCTGNRSP